jgi:hypothetical protein
MAEGDDYAKRTARIKNLLSSYYGDAGGGGGGGGAPGSQPGTPGTAAAGGGVGGAAAGTGSPRAGGSPAATGRGATRLAVAGATLSMDSPAFNADLHLQQMLRGLPLERLLGEHRAMAREIKNLDSDMQQLVYENYNKFITATGARRWRSCGGSHSRPALHSGVRPLRALRPAVADCARPLLTPPPCATASQPRPRHDQGHEDERGRHGRRHGQAARHHGCGAGRRMAGWRGQGGTWQGGACRSGTWQQRARMQQPHAAPAWCMPAHARRIARRNRAQTT